jgi:hypothetical protein
MEWALGKERAWAIEPLFMASHPRPVFPTVKNAIGLAATPASAALVVSRSDKIIHSVRAQSGTSRSCPGVIALNIVIVCPMAQTNPN